MSKTRVFLPKSVRNLLETNYVWDGIYPSFVFSSRLKFSAILLADLTFAPYFKNRTVLSF
jgi:hypothetical protein